MSLMSKETGAVKAVALANLSEALVVDTTTECDGKLLKVKVDYSAQVTRTTHPSRCRRLP